MSAKAFAPTCRYTVIMTASDPENSPSAMTDFESVMADYIERTESGEGVDPAEYLSAGIRSSPPICEPSFRTIIGLASQSARTFRIR